MYTYIHNDCHEIQCLIVKKWINIEHEVHDHVFCANSTNISKLEIVFDCPCISSTERTYIFDIFLLFDAYTILISSPVHFAKHWSILTLVVYSSMGSKHWC